MRTKAERLNWFNGVVLTLYTHRSLPVTSSMLPEIVYYICFAFSSISFKHTFSTSRKYFPSLSNIFPFPLEHNFAALMSIRIPLVPFQSHSSSPFSFLVVVTLFRPFHPVTRSRSFHSGFIGSIQLLKPPKRMYFVYT